MQSYPVGTGVGGVARLDSVADNSEVADLDSFSSEGSSFTLPDGTTRGGTELGSSLLLLDGTASGWAEPACTITLGCVRGRAGGEAGLSVAGAGADVVSMGWATGGAGSKAGAGVCEPGFTITLVPPLTSALAGGSGYDATGSCEDRPAALVIAAANVARPDTGAIRGMVPGTGTTS